MALNLGGGLGNPGYSMASPKFDPNSPTGYAQPTGPVWVGGKGADPRGPGQASLQAFYDWRAPGLNMKVGANPNIIDYTKFAAGNQAPASALGGSGALNSQPGQGGMNPGALQNYWNNNPGSLGQAINQNPGAFGMGGQSSPTSGGGQVGGGSAQGGNPAGGNQPGGMEGYFQNNPGALEQYWQDNPAALRTAISENPAMFAPAGLARDGRTDAPTGLKGAEQAMYGGLLGGMEQLNKGVEGAEGAYNQFGDAAKASLSGYAQQGTGASQYQANLTGANGPEAQAQAFAQYQESPEQAYLREQSERAITRNAAATGGLGGGNVLKELQRNATGLAAQDFQNSFNRLNTVADRGFNAAQGVSAIDAGMGDRIGGMRYGAGNTLADMSYGLGQALAGGRTRASELMAQNYGQTAQGMAGIQQQFGNDLSSVTGQGASNLANLLSGGGQAANQNYQQLAALLANIATGQGSQVAGLPGVPGTQQSDGMIDELLAIGAFVSDARLKTNVQKIGRTSHGVNLYSWDWTEEGAEIAGSQPTIGVIAQEVPWATFEGSDGYLRVDYTRV